MRASGPLARPLRPPRPPPARDRSNVKEARFTAAFVKGFTLVINALDNISARRHVNRLCLAADVPLIEAGTTGYIGQATVIRKGATLCYGLTGLDMGFDKIAQAAIANSLDLLFR